MAAGNLHHPAVNLRSRGNQHLAALEHVPGHAAAKGFTLLAGACRKPEQQPHANGGALLQFAGPQWMRVHNVPVRIGGVGALGQCSLRGRIPLHMADTHLYRAKVFFPELEYPWDKNHLELSGT